MNIIYIVIALIVIFYLLNNKNEGFAEASKKVNCTYYSETEEKMVYGLTEPDKCQGGYKPETEEEKK